VLDANAQRKVPCKDVSSGPVYISHLAPEDAFAKAEFKAYAEAVKRLGIQVTSSVSLLKSESYSSLDQLYQANNAFVELVQTFSKGWISDVTNHRWRVQNLESDPSKLPQLAVEVMIDAEVTECAGERDPEFQLEVRSDQQSYRANTRVNLSIVPTKSCYITIFNFDSDSVWLRFPQPQRPDLDNFARANEKFKIPGQLTALLPDNWKQSVDLIFVVATREKINFLSGRSNRSTSMDRQKAMMAIGEWLADIPLDKRRESHTTYTIIAE